MGFENNVLGNRNYVPFITLSEHSTYYDHHVPTENTMVSKQDISNVQPHTTMLYEIIFTLDRHDLRDPGP